MHIKWLFVMLQKQKGHNLNWVIMISDHGVVTLCQDQLQQAASPGPVSQKVNIDNQLSVQTMS